MIEIDNDISDDVDSSRMPENNKINLLQNRQQYVFDIIIQALQNTEAHR